MLGLFALILMVFVNSIKQIANSPEIVEIRDSIPSEDSGLFDNEYMDQLKPNKIYTEKGRASVSLISFGKDYHLFIYPIALIGDIPFRKLLSIQAQGSTTTNLKVYSIITHNNLIKFKYLDEPASPVAKIFIRVSGDSLQNVIENDTIASYHLLCKNFSISYMEDGPVSIFMEGTDRPFGYTIIPADLMLLKRQKKVYLLIMTPNNFKKGIPADLLYNIVRKS